VSGMPTVAWFHCFSGVAGDMALGALVDAGAEPDAIRELLGRLPVDGWELEFEPVLRCGIAATQAHVRVAETGVVRTAAHITSVVEEARLPERVARRSLAAFRALAEVEGRLHRRPPAQVHFHEVGGMDAIVDVVGTAAALEVLGVDDVR
jgi:pyridinium-3,5-bisthiocarboxylic acid mononucleotide nickel chelatase